MGSKNSEEREVIALELSPVEGGSGRSFIKKRTQNYLAILCPHWVLKLPDGVVICTP